MFIVFRCGFGRFSIIFEDSSNLVVIIDYFNNIFIDEDKRKRI